jgi:hypothetical protein
MFLCAFSSGLATTIILVSRYYYLLVEDLTPNVLPCIGSVCVTCHYHRSPNVQYLSPLFVAKIPNLIAPAHKLSATVQLCVRSVYSRYY